MKFHLRRRRSEPKLGPILDDDTAGWVRTHRRPFHEYSVGVHVPVVFNRYARIFHPARAGGDRPTSWEAIAEWSGRTMHALAQFDPLSRPLGKSAGAPPFVQPPDTGGLPPEQLAALCDVLAVHTSTADRCFTGMWEGYGWLTESDRATSVWFPLDGRTYLVQQGPLSTARRLGWRFGDEDVPFHLEPPTLIWPADRAWFVAADTDLDSTYIGGSGTLIADLLEHPSLETWPVNATDRVTYDSDTINGV